MGPLAVKAVPLSFPFGKEMDQSTVCQVHCQALLHNQRPYSRNNATTLMDTAGVHAVLYKSKSFLQFSASLNVTAPKEELDSQYAKQVGGKRTA